MTQLTGKKIIVTGGATGIGAAAVKAYVEEGGQVSVLDVNLKDGLSVVDKVDDANLCRFYRCDISERSQVEDAFSEATGWMNGLNVLVNLGAIISYKQAENFTDDEWDGIFAVNARGTMLTNQAAFHYMRESGGQIINAGSMSGIRPHPGNAAYSATKGAVMAWTRSVAAEWGAYDIRVNALAPVAQTPMSDIPPAGMTEEQQMEIKVALAQQLPLGRLGDVEADIAPVLVFLASDAAHYITGQVIAVDGGMAMLGS